MQKVELVEKINHQEQSLLPQLEFVVSDEELINDFLAQIHQFLEFVIRGHGQRLGEFRAGLLVVAVVALGLGLGGFDRAALAQPLPDVDEKLALLGFVVFEDLAAVLDNFDVFVEEDFVEGEDGEPLDGAERGLVHFDFFGHEFGFGQRGVFFEVGLQVGDVFVLHLKLPLFLVII